jgi:hypothetical protein
MLFRCLRGRRPLSQDVVLSAQIVTMVHVLYVFEPSLRSPFQVCSCHCEPNHSPAAKVTFSNPQHNHYSYGVQREPHGAPECNLAHTRGG